MTPHLGALLLAFLLPVSQGAPQPGAGKSVTGMLTALEADNLEDWLSGGTLGVDGRRVRVPASLLIELTGGDTVTLPQLFARAPARCRATHESGLLRTDACRRPPPPRAGDPSRAWSLEEDRTPRSYLDPIPTDEAPVTTVRVTGARGEDGVLLAATVSLTRTDRLSGAVTYINEEEGYLRVNGALGSDAGGALLRINDPDGRFTIQGGTGCGGEGNCSPDVRFKANAPGPSVRFEQGSPACVPSPGGYCTRSRRPANMPADEGAPLPILPGDHITALGGFEVHDGVRVFWAHTVVDHSSPTG